MRTPVRWAGSKKTLLPTLRQHWRNDKSGVRYVEPFCGSACLFFDLEPKSAILSDINRELITAYREIKSRPLQVIDCLKDYKQNKEFYYRLRGVDPATMSKPEIAARFLFLNRLCFNGIYRTNKGGAFNVPYARPKRRRKFDTNIILDMSRLLKRAQLIDDDFEAVLDEVRTEDFVYLDPPFAVANRRVFAEYHPDSFSSKDIKRLGKSLRVLDRRGSHFVLSYANSAEGRGLVADWNWRRIRTRRNIAGFVGDRRSAYELIASNRELPNGH